MSMSHDFRTPASGVYLMSKFVYEKLTDDKLKKMQKLVVDSSSKLLRLLEDVLESMNINNMQNKIHISKIDVAKEINEVISFMSAKAAEKKLTMTFNHPQTLIFYDGDKMLLNRILINIISNAIKFTEVGEITITLCEDEDNTDNFIIAIADTGIGIDNEHHDSIFDPFVRVSSAENSKYSGVGLGLSNVRLMLNKLGGKIVLTSSLGHGSTFSIWLPYHS